MQKDLLSSQEPKEIKLDASSGTGKGLGNGVMIRIPSDPIGQEGEIKMDKDTDMDLTPMSGI